MARQSSNDWSTWWERNNFRAWFYPQLPSKKELIYRVFRAAYPHGAFVDDNLKLVELRDKDTIWRDLEAQFAEASKDLDYFLLDQFRNNPQLRGKKEKQKAVSEYYRTLLSESRYALYISQNGRYYEFRSMEELLVRYRHVDEKTRTGKSSPTVPFSLAGFGFAVEHLEPTEENKIKILERRIKTLEELDRRA
ncbi:hypothetical protein F4776DRAFT_606924 [Hypoxylon sp. NC0597]|nr:hypothetical protein F4776DRAFT_606924 [Hypoxylon sp. NC0597]